MLLLTLQSACTRTPPPAEFAGPTMGTTYHVTVAGLSSDAAQAEVQVMIDTALRDAQRHLSTYDEASELALLNRSTSQDWQDVSSLLYAVLKAAREASEQTGGAFDVTVGPVLELWGYDPTAAGDAATPRAFTPPSATRISAARERIGWQRLELRSSPRTAVRRSVAGMQVTLDAIAPGFIVDRIAEELLARGHRDFIVEIGGEVRAHGVRPDGKPWRIAVEAPLAAEREALLGVRLRDAAVSTSGDYRDARFDAAGRRYSHTVDPRTGRTVEGALTAVTVIDPSATRADAYATALMVMGASAGLQWATELRIPVLFVERTQEPGQWHLVESPAFKEWRE